MLHRDALVPVPRRLGHAVTVEGVFTRPGAARRRLPGQVRDDGPGLDALPARRGLAKDKVDVEAGRGRGDLVDEGLRRLVVADAQDRGNDGPLPAALQEHHLLRQALKEYDGDGVVDARDAAADDCGGVDPDALARVLPDQGPTCCQGDGGIVLVVTVPLEGAVLAGRLGQFILARRVPEGGDGGAFGHDGAEGERAYVGPHGRVGDAHAEDGNVLGGADAVDEEPLVELVLPYLGEEDGDLVLDAVGDDVGAGHDAVPAVRQVGVHEETGADAGRLLGRQVGAGKVNGRPVGFNANAGLFGVLLHLLWWLIYPGSEKKNNLRQSIIFESSYEYTFLRIHVVGGHGRKGVLLVVGEVRVLANVHDGGLCPWEAVQQGRAYVQAPALSDARDAEGNEPLLHRNAEDDPRKAVHVVVLVHRLDGAVDFKGAKVRTVQGSPQVVGQFADPLLVSPRVSGQFILRFPMVGLYKFVCVYTKGKNLMHPAPKKKILSPMQKQETCQRLTLRLRLGSSISLSRKTGTFRATEKRPSRGGRPVWAVPWVDPFLVAAVVGLFAVVVTGLWWWRRCAAEKHD